MKTLHLKLRVLTLMIGLGLSGSARAAGDFHFGVGVAGASGYFDVMDKLDNNWNYDEQFVFPAGLTFQPYYEFDFGLGIGASVGPAALILVDVDSYYDNDVRFSYIVPVGLDLRYTFLRKKNVSPYVRAGVRYPIAGGDDIDSSSEPGPFGAIGVEFWRTKAVGMAVEVGYDGSQVKIKPGRVFGSTQQEATFSGWTISIMAVF